ncbi:hypothetical protein lerEdw1_007304 [Lerista edwardsae]|nr:hypothetical protein lerEdw1_007304 [Lerista edwardsae]
MDYLTVPATPSVAGIDKAGEQAPGTAPVPSPSTMSELMVPIPPSADISTVLAATSVIPPVKSREDTKPSKPSRFARGSRQPSGQRPKPTLKGHRRKRRHRRTMKDLLMVSWKTLHPKLIHLRKIIYNLSQSFSFDLFIFTVVGINTFFLVVQTFAVVEIRGEWFFTAMDPVFLCIYVMEAILKLIALGCSYFRDWWNNIDFFIMIMTVLDFVLSLSIYRTTSRSNTIRTFRILKICKGIRAIRAIRYILSLHVMRNIREAACTFALSAKSIGAIILLMLTFLCILPRRSRLHDRPSGMFSVVLHDLFHDKDPKHFGDIFKTVFTLFQFLTLDDCLVIAVLVDNFQMGLMKRQELQKQSVSFAKLIQLKDSSEHIPSAEAKLPPWARAEKIISKEDDEAFFRDRVAEKYGSLDMSDSQANFLLLPCLEFHLGSNLEIIFNFSLQRVAAFLQLLPADDGDRDTAAAVPVAGRHL